MSTTLSRSLIETDKKQCEFLNEEWKETLAMRYWLSRITSPNFLDDFADPLNKIPTSAGPKSFKNIMSDIATTYKPLWWSSWQVTWKLDYLKDTTLIKVLQWTANFTLSWKGQEFYPQKNYVWSTLKRSSGQWALDVDWKLWQHTLEFARNYVADNHLKLIKSKFITKITNFYYNPQKAQYVFTTKTWAAIVIERDNADKTIKNFATLSTEITSKLTS